ncbi:neprilysin-like isoform X2 [Ceratina calcarata]|uniref:Neprilysin-like isoform X2 n=1 Tax=Ceratina calcarata TaxID=156304 RepID=A0AAJ7IV06_9HYME|nr:neprilysin-like isoform X2 [Ceratina calcarata]
MQLPWLLCHLTIATAIPTTMPSSAFARVWRIVNTMNETEQLAEPEGYSENPNVCQTLHCHEIANRILNNRDVDADPCEDFYQYACGSWSVRNPMPENEVEWSEDQLVMDKTNSRIKEMLEEEDSHDDILPVRMARKLYRTCMDEDAIERRGVQPIQEILDQHGGWPMAMPVNEWDPNETSWQKIDKHYVTLIGNSAFYNLEYEIDLNNTKRYVLTLDQDTEYPLTSKRDLANLFYNDDAYALGIFRVAQAFAREQGYTLNRRQLASDIANLVNFEIELLQVIHTVSDNYERMTVKQLQKWYNSSGVASPTAKIDFLDVIQHAFKLANIRINSSEPVIVYNPEFLHKLAKLLGETSRRVLVNYVQWNMVDKYLMYTTQEMRDIKFNISYSTYNVSNFTPRWQVCVYNMKMKNAISYMFVKRYITDHVIHEATRMVKRIKDELRHRIEQAHWLPSSMKMTLLQKINNLEAQVGYPEWYKNDHAIIQYYDGLHIGTDYFQNVLNCEQSELIKSLIEFRDVVVRDQWLDYPITVNAFYAQTVNTILIPAAELQDPFFSPHLPDAVNYGTTGFVIGHELSHSFDNEGIQFDKNGYKISWPSRFASTEYEERSMCFVDQYGNYTLDIRDDKGKHIRLDGNLTEDENMADSMGVQIAYSAYKKAAKQKHQAKLPGLEYISNDELFFLSFANSWCSSTRPEYEADVINTDEHSPAKYRIIGSLSNMPSFAKTFKCSRSSSMNRRHKCTLWN